ncbi:MAG TPA: HEAT repeat domain-containing protein [Polyangiaceae bacterium]|nr:HEAT repeat domain-containing protein [Polyangiaceae bacterium]
MSRGAGWLAGSARCAAGALGGALLALSPAAPAAPAAVAPAAPAPAAPPDRSLSVPGSAEQKPLQVELAGDAVWFAVCARAGCSARSGKSIELPPEARSGAGAVLETVELAADRHLAHVLVPLPGAGAAWEALLAAPVHGEEALLLFAGVTGAVQGEEGQREGDRLWIREGDKKGRRVLLGRVREDVELCGRPTILEPRLLDRDLALRPAKVQQLTLEERRSAPVLDARRTQQPTSGGNALRALAASSAIGNPAFASDGRADTSWSEGRGGDGRGEFVTFRQLSGSALVALEFSFHPPGDAAPADGAAPRSIWVATRSSVLRVDFPEDGWRQPGAWYRVELPAPISEDCLAIVLESSYAASAQSSVTLAEVRGVSELQGLDPTALVARLSTPGDAGAAVVPALLQLGPAGVDAVVGAFGALDSLGRVRALDVLEAGPCEAVAGAYVELLSDEDARLRRRAEQRLQGCSGELDEPLRQAFDRSSGQGGVRLAAALAELSPALAVELLGPRLTAAPREQRPQYRAALQAAAQHPAAGPGIRKLLAENSLGVSSDIELLRSLAGLLPRWLPESAQVFERAATQARSFEQRYLLLRPAAALASRDARARAFLEGALRDGDPYLRLAAARNLPGELSPALVATTRDPEVRVREAGVARLGELRPAAALAPLRERLADDPWPLVRAASARALAGLGPSAEIDGALAARLEDPSELVRSAALRALGQRGAQPFLPAIRERFADAEESGGVRASAAQALAQLCDRGSLDAFTLAARDLLGSRSTDAALVGTASIAALGRLHPADLQQRLEPLARASNQPALRALVLAALEATDRCPLAPVGSAAQR